MKWLTFPKLPLPPPKSSSSSSSAAAAAAVSLTSIFPSCTRSYPHNFGASSTIWHSTHFKQSIYSSSHPRQMAATATGESTVSSSPAVIKLKPIEATPESFREFGQVIEASPDGDGFGPRDAQLDLSRGIPRFYILHLEDRPLEFSSITHHAKVTQCLGSIGGHVWYLGVSKPSLVEKSDEIGANNAVRSRHGHSYVPPAVDQVRLFKVSGSKFLKLDRGTWHAGPLFLEKAMDFYNLELSNTNVVDHTTHNFARKDNVIFAVDE